MKEEASEVKVTQVSKMKKSEKQNQSQVNQPQACHKLPKEYSQENCMTGQWTSSNSSLKSISKSQK